MKRLFLNAFLILLSLVGFCQLNSFKDLQNQLDQAGYDTSNSIDTYIIVSDEISKDEVALITPLINWWENPISHAHFILSGKEKRFKRLFSKEQLSHRKIHLDKNGVLKQRLGDQDLIEIIFTSEKKIIKRLSVDQDNMQTSFTYLEQWQYGLWSFPHLMSKTLDDGQKAPSIDETTISNIQVSLDSMKGKVVILHFWTSPCVGCIVEILNKLNEEYENEDVIFLSIYQKSEESLRGYLEIIKNPDFDNYFTTFPIITDAVDIIDNYKVSAFPLTYTINPSGRIERKTQIATVNDNKDFTYDALKGQIERLLAIKEYSQKLEATE